MTKFVEGVLAVENKLRDVVGHADWYGLLAFIKIHPWAVGVWSLVCFLFGVLV